MTKKYSKERLDKSRFLFLEPSVESGISYALGRLEEGDISHFLNSVAKIDSKIEHHIINNCSNAEDEETRIDCINKDINIKVSAINRLSERLVDKCGGKMNYIEDIENMEDTENMPK